MKKLSNTEANLKKSVAYQKKRVHKTIDQKSKSIIVFFYFVFENIASTDGLSANTLFSITFLARKSYPQMLRKFKHREIGTIYGLIINVDIWYERGRQCETWLSLTWKIGWPIILLFSENLHSDLWHFSWRKRGKINSSVCNTLLVAVEIFNHVVMCSNIIRLNHVVRQLSNCAICSFSSWIRFKASISFNK